MTKKKSCIDRLYFDNHNKVSLKLIDEIDIRYSKYGIKKVWKKDLEKVNKLYLDSNTCIFKTKDKMLKFGYKNIKKKLFKEDISHYIFSERELTESDSVTLLLKLKYNLVGEINYSLVSSSDTYFEIEYEAITSFEVIENKQILWRDTFSLKDYINPNMWETFQSYKPIEVFYNKNTNSFYSLFSGKGDMNYSENEFWVLPSYLTRLELNLKNRTISHLSFDYSLLKLYGWPYCDNFWIY